MKRRIVSIAAVATLVAVVLLIQRTAGSSNRFTILPIAIFAGSAATYVIYRLDQLRTPTILITAVVLRVILIPMQPVFSDDAYRYLWDGQLGSHGINPYLELPSEQRSIPVLENYRYDRLNSKNYYSVYPPVSQYVFTVAAKIGQGSWERTYLALKILLVLFELLGVFLLSWYTSRRSLLLYALNPAVIFEVAGQAHTEAIAIPFIIGAIVFAASRKPVRAGAALSLATLVKLFPVVLLLSFGRRVKGYRAPIAFCLVATVVSAPLFRPGVISNGLSSLNLYVRLFEFNAGPYLVAKESLRFATGLDFSKQLGPLFAIIAAAAIVIVSIRIKWLDDDTVNHPDNSKRRLAASSVTIFGILIAFATTVHPWYFLPLLAVVALSAKPHWHWQWLAVVSSGTYVFYSDGPYLWFVFLGWGGALLLFVASQRHTLLSYILRRRAKTKAQVVLALDKRIAEAGHVLDLGSAEGFVGDELHKRTGTKIHLADIRNSNLTKHDFTLVTGKSLPFDDDFFDHTVLYFVLHHAEDQQAVISEAVRCTRCSVIVVESTFHSEVEHKLLTLLDTIANRIRSFGTMSEQESDLHFRTINGWSNFTEDAGLRITNEKRWGTPLHRQFGFVIDASSAITK